jgi:hypothetical protein
VRVWRYLQTEVSDQTPAWRLAGLFARRVATAWRPTNHAALGVSAARRSRHRALIHPQLRPWLQENHAVDRYFRSSSIREQQALLFNDIGYHRERLETWAILGRRLGLRYVFPLLDRRIVELAHCLPIGWYQRHGRNRYLYRRALGGVVPAALLEAGKRPETRRVAQLLNARQSALTSDAVLERLASAHSDYIDTGELRRRCLILREQATPVANSERKLELKTLYNAVLTLNLYRRQRG